MQLPSEKPKKANHPTWMTGLVAIYLQQLRVIYYLTWRTYEANLVTSYRPTYYVNL